METLIIHPETSGQIQALKAFLNAFKIHFEAKTENQKIAFSDLAANYLGKTML